MNSRKCWPRALEKENGEEVRQERAPPDHDDGGGAAAEGVRPAVHRLPVLVHHHLAQPQAGALLLLHQAQPVTVDPEEVLVKLVERELLATVLPRPGPLAPDRHEGAVCLVLQPQLGPGLGEEGAAAPASVPAPGVSRADLHTIDQYQPPRTACGGTYSHLGRAYLVLLQLAETGRDYGLHCGVSPDYLGCNSFISRGILNLKKTKTFPHLSYC